MLSGTRASLSTDAPVDFLVVQAKDPRLKASITILRYIPDIKGLIYMRYSRSDFEDRMVLESDAKPRRLRRPPGTTWIWASLWRWWPPAFNGA